jgi:aspartyl-tRNA(Asn)/glutamyl-tRNA(Gln) amidotransferase subunit C
MIDKKKVEYIAGLARLELSEGETAGYARQLGDVLGYVEQLDSVDTSGVEPTCFVIPDHDPLRPDIRAESLDSEAALKNGPETKKGFFAIPNVMKDSKS